MLSAFGAAEMNATERAAMNERIAVFGDPARLAAELAFIRSTEEAMRDAMKLPEAEFHTIFLN